MTETEPKKRAMSEVHAVDRSARRAVATFAAKAADIHRQTAFIRGRVQSGYLTPEQLNVVRQHASELQRRVEELLRDFELQRKGLAPQTRDHSRIVDVARSLTKAIGDLASLQDDRLL